MAGRSDFNSIFPRQLKRQLALSTFDNEHQRGDVRRLLIAAHDHEKKMRNRALAARDNASLSSGGDAE